jgi:hypothetical protein
MGYQTTMAPQRRVGRRLSKPAFRGRLAVLTAAALLPLSIVIPTSAQAATGTTCKSATGKAAFTPALPRKGSAAKVFPVLAATGTIGACTGGGVTGGTTRFKSSKSATGQNCTTFGTYNTAVITGTESITWNTRSTSMIALTFHKVSGHPTEASLTGTVASGPFKGMHISGLLGFAFPSGACVSTGLSSFSYKNLRAELFAGTITTTTTTTTARTTTTTTTAPGTNCSDNSTLPHTWVSGDPNSGIGPAGTSTDHFYLKIPSVCSSTLTGTVNLKSVVSGTNCPAGGDWKIEIRQGTSSTTLVHDRGTGTRTLTYTTAVVGQEYRFRVANLSTCTVTASAAFTS